MKAVELNYESINKWFRFSHGGFERFGRLTGIDMNDGYNTAKPPVINVRWKTTDDLSGYAVGVALDLEFTPVADPTPEPSDAA